MSQQAAPAVGSRHGTLRDARIHMHVRTRAHTIYLSIPLAFTAMSASSDRLYHSREILGHFLFSSWLFAHGHLWSRSRPAGGLLVYSITVRHVDEHCNGREACGTHAVEALERVLAPDRRIA